MHTGMREGEILRLALLVSLLIPLNLVAEYGSGAVIVRDGY